METYTSYIDIIIYKPHSGTSVTHQAGIACRHFNVSKVWPRDLSTKFATPHEMAIHDRKYFYNG